MLINTNQFRYMYVNHCVSFQYVLIKNTTLLFSHSYVTSLKHSVSLLSNSTNDSCWTFKENKWSTTKINLKTKTKFLKHPRNHPQEILDGFFFGLQPRARLVMGDLWIGGSGLNLTLFLSLTYKVIIYKTRWCFTWVYRNLSYT